MRRLTVLIAPALILLAACQTTPSVPPKAQDAAGLVVRNHCIVKSSRGSYLVDKEKIGEEVIVNSIGYGGDFWTVYDVTFRSVRDVTYLNIASGEVVCGRNNWHRTDVTFGPEPPWRAESVPPTPIAWADVRTGFRPFVLTWEGYTKEFAGRMKFQHRKRKGTTFAELPNDDGRCYGSYRYFKKGQGTWSTACTNGLTAFGAFTTDGEQGPGSGTGSDAKGREVRFTLGPMESRS